VALPPTGSKTKEKNDHKWRKKGGSTCQRTWANEANGGAPLSGKKSKLRGKMQCRKTGKKGANSIKWKNGTIHSPETHLKGLEKKEEFRKIGAES